MEQQQWRPSQDERAAETVYSRPSVVWLRFLSWAFANVKRVTWMGVVAAAAWGIYSYANSPTGVQYVLVRTVTTSETIAATGKVRGERVADIGLGNSGIVQRIHVREGDRVSAGALILSLDKSELDARMQGAANAVLSAEAELSKAGQGPLPSEIRQVRAELAQADSVGRARVAQAEARLKDLQSGARPQEVSEAEAELRRRRELLAKAEADLKRVERLVKVGAIARMDLDQARTAVSTAEADVSAQQHRISLLKAGARSDQLAEARAAVAEARASRDTGTMAARERLNSLLALPRPEDVRAARARVEEARSELRRARDVVAKTDARAPFSGIVADIRVEQGQSISPGQPLAVIHEITRPVIEVETDEENLGVLTIGQKAVVSCDAYTGQTFEATVVDLGSMVNAERGTIQIKLRPTANVNWLRPDLTVDVNIVTRNSVRRVVLPADAVTKADRHSCVLVERDGIAVPVRVKTGAAGMDGIVVSGDLKDGEKVIRNASKVAPFSEVRLTGGG